METNVQEPDFGPGMHYPKNALALLSVQEGVAFGDAQIQRYSVALHLLHKEIGWSVVQHLALKRWRPSPEEILQAACRQYAPRPDNGQTFAEITHRVLTWEGLREGLVFDRQIGTNGAYRLPQAGETPHVYQMNLRAVPGWSHPIVCAAVVRCGSWAVIQERLPRAQNAYKELIDTAHAALESEWDERLALPEMALPRAQQNPAIVAIYLPARAFLPAEAQALIRVESPAYLPAPGVLQEDVAALAEKFRL